MKSRVCRSFRRLSGQQQREELQQKRRLPYSLLHRQDHDERYHTVGSPGVEEGATPTMKNSFNLMAAASCADRSHVRVCELSLGDEDSGGQAFSSSLQLLLQTRPANHVNMIELFETLLNLGTLA